MRRSLLILALVAVVACGEPGVLRPIEAPGPGGVFAVQFSADYPPGHWSVGDHGYRMEVSCDEPAIVISPPVRRMTVSAGAPTFDGIVSLRFDGPGTAPLAPADLDAIDPSQATRAVLTLVGLLPDEARSAVETCEARIVADGGDPVPMVPSDPFIP